MIHPSLRQCLTMALAAFPVPFAGCGTTSPAPVPAMQPVPVAPPSVIASSAAVPGADGIPVYRPPVVVEVGTRPYVNAEGDLILPGRRFTVLDPGGWNPAVLDEPGRAVIAGASGRAAPPPGAAVAAVPGAEGATGEGWLAALPWDRVAVLGMAEPSREDEAQAAASRSGEGRVAVWSATLGWLAVPGELLVGGVP